MTEELPLSFTKSMEVPGNEHIEVACTSIGKLNVFVQGTRSPTEVVILTVHDVGYDHEIYTEFVGHLNMKRMRDKTVWVHVDLPGQGKDSTELPPDFVFPTIQLIAGDLIQVLDQLKIREVVGFGSGAGANIVARFAMAHPDKVLGVCLLDCTGTAAGLLETLHEKVLKSTDSYHIGDKSNGSDVLIPLQRKANARNVKKYSDAFMKRSSIIDNIGKLTGCSVLFITGQKSLLCRSARHLHHALMKHSANKSKVEYIEVKDAANVLDDKPEKVAESFQYFLQGLGLISSIPMAQLTKLPPRLRSMSMQEYDMPKLRVRSLSTGTGASSPPSSLSTDSRPRFDSIPEQALAQ